MCNADVEVEDQDHTCSQTASCALTSSSTAASFPQETVLHLPLNAPAESQPCTQSQQGELSQLSTMTAGGVCASQAILPPHRHPQGSSQGHTQGGLQGVTQGGVETGAQGVAERGVQGVGQGYAQEAAQRQGVLSKNAVAAAAQTVQANIDAGSHLLTKAGLLIQRLFEPAAVLAMLGFDTREVLDLELQTQQQQVASKSQTQAGAQLSSVDSPRSAKTGTAAVPAGTEAAEAAAGHPLTNGLYVGSDHTAQADQQQGTGKQDSGASLLTLLGLGGAAEGSGGGANRLISVGSGKEEEAKLQVDRQAGIALHVVEALLNAALTQPEVGGFPSLPHALSPLWPPPPNPRPIWPVSCIPPPLHHTAALILCRMKHVTSVLMTCINCSLHSV